MISASQRNRHSKGTLEAGRERRLRDVPGWVWDAASQPKWEDGFSRLLDYVERRGGARVPASYKVDGHTLGSWVTTQRVFYREGTLEADRQQRLQDVPGWTWDPFADDWEDGFRRLREYVELSGHALVPASYKVDGKRLGGWVARQRTNYVKGTLEADRQQRLQDVPGWVWDARSGAAGVAG